MNTTAGRQSDDALIRLSSRVTNWVLGTGLLSLHASVFTLSIIAMVFRNIYDSPNDLWVDEVFRRWAVVLAFHAIAVAAGWTAWRLLRAEQQAIDAARTTWTPAVLPASTQPVSPNRWPQQSGANQPYPASSQRMESVAKRALVSYTTWSGTLARRTKSVVSLSASRWISSRSNPPENASTGAPDSTQSWPQGPIRTREEDEEFIARFGIQTTQEWTSAPADHTPANGTSEPTTPSVSKDAGQTWVEAATGSWIAPKDDELSPESRHSNGHHPPPDETPGSDEPANDGPAQT
jgi:hypothetical protein